MSITVFVGGVQDSIDYLQLKVDELDIDIHDPSGNAGISRFIDLFNEVWCKIPIDDRQMIREHIRRGAIILTENSSDSGLCCKYKYDEYRSWMVATYHNRTGRDFHYWMPFLKALPEKHACTLIALTLAYARCYADPECIAHDFRHSDLTRLVDERESMLEAIEYEAIRTVIDWGFDYNSADKYCHNHPYDLPRPYNPYKVDHFCCRFDPNCFVFRVSTDW